MARTAERVYFVRYAYMFMIIRHVEKVPPLDVRENRTIVWYFRVHCLMRCEITTVGDANITLFEDITPGSVVNSHQCLGNMYCLYLLVTYSEDSRSRRSSGCYLSNYRTSRRRKANLQLVIIG
jgi:hypothetical protein